VRTELGAALPGYMVPTAFVILDAFPLNASGKLDRKALPAPDEPGGDRPYEAPEGEIEQKLARIWAELLDQPRIGRHDDFFALGGHSLLAITLLERMRREQLHTDVTSIFTAATLSELALATTLLKEIVL
jgi:hypothetical protein